MRKRKPTSKQTRLKISLALKGRKLSPAHIKAMAKGKTGVKLTDSHKRAISLGTKGKNGKWMKGRHLKQETIDKIRRKTSGEKSVNWKGDNVGYRGIHHWIAKKLGKPRICAVCGSRDKTSPKAYHWANISRCYKRELSDWIRLCVPCHRKYDLGKMKLC